MSWNQFPKVELHLHHEGAAPPAFIRQLAHEKKVDLEGVFNDDGSYAFKDFVHFLSVYEAATSVLKSPEDYARLTTAVLEECAANGVIYAESFISPDFCGGRDVGAWKEYLHAIQEAADKAEAAHGITLKGIVTCIRHFGGEWAKETAQCAAETKGDFITGFGMGGDENQFTQGTFKWAFDCAREAGLQLTTHAGEWGGPESIRQALDDLKVERLGHGVQVIEDEALMQRVIDEGVTLEVCPGSNVVLGVYPSIKDHPIKRLRDAGVKVTVSTDDPPFFHTTMTKEYEMLEQAFGWGAEDFTTLNMTAIDAAFCDADTKTRIKQRLEA
ncbi:adenosine deaminase [Thalassovita sp.]|uniref:adenosine deaminase n=1 Tax=Thalassovita sp. TaxID=1979401 RepID=UPI002AB15A44|nr:adenosine deaminase [Thalassovita sp.]